VAQDSLFWTASYMDAAARRATAQDPQWGLSAGMSPLAALSAARWRQEARRRQRQGEGEGEEGRQEEEEEPQGGRGGLLAAGLAGCWACQAAAASRPAVQYGRCQG
jgi:hypothetical protein